MAGSMTSPWDFAVAMEDLHGMDAVFDSDAWHAAYCRLMPVAGSNYRGAGTYDRGLQAAC